jgi:hypothetical protein
MHCWQDSCLQDVVDGRAIYKPATIFVVDAGTTPVTVDPA